MKEDIMFNKVVSVRMNLQELAKARDGLLAQELDPTQINTVSQILKLTFYYGMMAICDDPKSSPSDESIAFIKQRISQKNVKGIISLDDIIKNKK